MVILLVPSVVEIEIGKVKVQPRKAGGFMVTLPMTAVKMLQIKDNEIMKVFIDIEKHRVTYELEG